MISIAFVEPNTREWEDWKTKCREWQLRHNDSVELGDEISINSGLYKAQKHQVYLNTEGPFHGKCAYCEQRIKGDQPGDVEHFRPKKAITDEVDNPIMISEDGETRPHPGYYWLVYEWRNLLPSCSLCNRPSTDYATGDKIGKRNRFPVIGCHAIRPGQEAVEKPLLLHPCYDDPSEHLDVDASGIFSEKTNRGAMCITIFGLNLRELPAYRRQKYQDVKLKMQALAHASAWDRSGSTTNRLLKEILSIKHGYDEFTAVSRKAIADSRDNVIAAFGDLDS